MNNIDEMTTQPEALNIVAPTTIETWMPEARQIAAQCWCDAETEHLQMDPVLAEAVAHRIAAWMETGAAHARNESYWRDRAKAAADARAVPPVMQLKDWHESEAHKQADKDFCAGWNACRDAILAALGQPATHPAAVPLTDARTVLRKLVQLEADGQHASESAIETWEQARAALGQPEAAADEPTVPVPVVVAWSGGAAPYSFVRLRLDDTPTIYEYVPGSPFAAKSESQADVRELVAMIERLGAMHAADYPCAGINDAWRGLVAKHKRQT